MAGRKARKLNLIKSQIKAYGLKNQKHVYSLRLSDKPDGITVSSPRREAAEYKWSDVYGIFGNRGCTYLCVTSNKAFLLPDCQIDGGEGVLRSLFSIM